MQQGPSSSQSIEREVTVQNREGLHFRPIMKLVDAVGAFSSRIVVHCEDRSADARSPMELLMLVATQGCKLTIRAEGADAAQAADAVAALFDAGFNET
ncbi:MAG: HPr family phosphocarrier protein [Phycisphaerae bacterium]